MSEKNGFTGEEVSKDLREYIEKKLAKLIPFRQQLEGQLNNVVGRILELENILNDNYKVDLEKLNQQQKPPIQIPTDKKKEEEEKK